MVKTLYRRPHGKSRHVICLTGASRKGDKGTRRGTGALHPSRLESGVSSERRTVFVAYACLFINALVLLYSSFDFGEPCATQAIRMPAKY